MDDDLDDRSSWVDAPGTDGTCLSRLENAAPRRLTGAIVEHDALAKGHEVASGHASVNVSDIGLLNMARGVKQLVGEVAISGEEQEPRCVEVEPPHGKEPGMKIGWNELGHTGPPLRVAHGGEIACGFMEHEVDGALGQLDHVPVDGDYIAIDVDLGAKLACHLAVYRNTASGHKVF